MLDLEKYFKVETETILPVMERLRAEYGAKGYGCDIDRVERIGNIPSQTFQRSGADSPIVSQISIIRKDVANDNENIVTVFLARNGIIGVAEPRTIGRGTTWFTLSDINEENLKNEIRDRFDPIGSK